MPRKRTELSPLHEARLVALAGAGRTAEEIAAALAAEGVTGLSRATVARRLLDLRGAQRVRGKASRPAPVEAPPLPATPEDIPEGTDLETIERWLETAERMARKAEADGNLAGLGAMGRLAKGLLEAKRRATPPTPPDPNANPDMVALGAEVAKRLHKLVDDAAGPEGPPRA